MPCRTAPAWPDRPPPLTVQIHVELVVAVGDQEGLRDQHAQHGPGEILADALAVDVDLALAGLDPYARHRVLAPAGGVAAAERVALGLALRLPPPVVTAAATARSLRSASVRVWVPDIVSGSPVLRVHRGDIERVRLLAVMRMARAGIDVQMLHLLALQRAARDHALDRLLQHPLGMRAGEALAQRAALDAAGIAGVLVEHRLARPCCRSGAPSRR